MLPVALLITVSSPYSIILFIAFFGTEHTIATVVVSSVCLLFLLIGLSLVRDNWRTLTFDGPALVIDERGVTNHYNNEATIPWRDIERIDMGGSDVDTIIIDVRNHSEYGSPPKRSLFKVARRLVQRINSSGDLNIVLSDMIYRRKELKMQLQEFQAWATKIKK